MVREFPTEGVVHVRVFPSGEIERIARSRAVPLNVLQEIESVEVKRMSRAGSQLLTVRLLSLYGWRVTDPALWEEAES
jgi:hypothetical protein